MRKLIAFATLMALLSASYAQGITTEEYRVDATAKYTVAVDGNAFVEEVLKFTPNLYLKMKEAYPTTYMLQRDIFENKRAKAEYENAVITWDDSKNRLSATYTMRGIAVYKGDHVELAIGDKKADVTLTTITGTTVILTASIPLGNGGRMIQTATVALPPDAKDIKFAEGTITYDLPPAAYGGGANSLYLMLAMVSLAGIAGINVAPRILSRGAGFSLPGRQESAPAVKKAAVRKKK